MTFWITAALLALAAIGFALAPFLWRGGGARSNAPDVAGTPSIEAGGKSRHDDAPPSRGDRDRVLRALYRQRVEELEAESAAGILEPSSRAEVEQELGRGLLDAFAGTQAVPGMARAVPGMARAVPGMARAVPGMARAAPGTARAVPETAGAPEPGKEDSAAEPPSPAEHGQGIAGHEVPKSAQRHGWAWLLAASCIPLLALALYLQVGEPDAGVLREAVAVLQLDPERDRLELDRWRVLLADRLNRVPDDAQSRYLLGRVYLMDGEYRRAAESFALAHAIVGDDPSIDLVWLQALYLAESGWLDDQGMRIAERILERDPNQPLVLEITAIDAYRRGDYSVSVGHFSRALANDALQPMQRASLELFLRQARSMLGDLEPSVDVRLIALETPPTSATLFVIARPVGGGMPYAVVRRTAVPLPEQVRLDDAVSMNPALPLSAASEIEVVARISLTGAAVSHPGDWEWRSAPLSLEDVGTLALKAELGPPGRPN